jgi:hypothetical protein
MVRLAVPSSAPTRRQRPRNRSTAQHPLDGFAYGGLVGPITDTAALLALHLGSIPGGRQIISPDNVAHMQHMTTPGRRFDLGLGWFPPTPQRRGRASAQRRAFGCELSLFGERVAASR